jgi:hypothetical protein
MDRFLTRFSALALLAVLGGCASGPKPPPEPDMTKLVIVNRTIPAELVGSLPVITEKQDAKQ